MMAMTPKGRRIRLAGMPEGQIQSAAPAWACNEVVGRQRPLFGNVTPRVTPMSRTGDVQSSQTEVGGR